MKHLLCKAKALKTKKEYTGYYVFQEPDEHYLVNPKTGTAICKCCTANRFTGYVLIDPKTVRRYVTDDKNGEPVFAGDKCKVPINDEIMREFEDSDYWELEATVARGFNYWGDVQGHTFTEISDYKTEDIELLKDGEK